MIINILLNFNNGYAQHACVLLASIFENNKNVRFNIYILHLDISDDNINTLKSFSASYGNNVVFYKVSTNGLVFPNLSNHYISVDAYLRLFLSYYLPDNLDKILYLDVDMCVIGNIEDLFTTELDENILAAIEDAPKEGRHKRLNLPLSFGYFNSGMMLINLNKWRSEKITEKAISFITKHNDIILQHDQDVLNSVLNGRWKRIDFKWNVLSVFFFDPPIVASNYKEELLSSLKDIRIIHFTGGVKPWQAWEKNPYHDTYYKYLSYTPWDGYKPSIVSKWKAYKFPRNIFSVLGLYKYIVHTFSQRSFSICH